MSSPQEKSADESTAGRGLLLGVVGWDREDWVGCYYPEDLPEDWRLAYLANDADAVMLRPAEWCGLDLPGTQRLADALAEAPGLLVLLHSEGAGGPAGGDLAPFADHDVAVLVDRIAANAAALPRWPAAGIDRWSRPDGSLVQRWWLDDFHLPAVRGRLEALDPSVMLLLLDGPACCPAHLRELRTLAGLLRMA
jgi:hypothetical protein